MLRHVVPFEVGLKCERQLNWTQVSICFENCLLPIVKIEAARYLWIKRLYCNASRIAKNMLACSLIYDIRLPIISVLPINMTICLLTITSHCC